MKRILFGFILSLPLLACAGESTSPATPTAGNNPIYYTSPDVPLSMKIFGKDVDLSRSDFHERFDRELMVNSYLHGSTLLNLKRANRLFPVLEPILKKNGIPRDMLYLAVIESNLDPRAVSPAKAAGIWQFMASTAKQYGLEVNDYVDERYNIEKATEAACRYFKDAYAKYGDWMAVAAAYNAGMARITQERASQQQDNVLDLYLVTETTRYPYRIMAVKLIMEDPEKYGFHLRKDQLYKPVEYDEVVVDSPVDNWVEWVKKYNISYAQLREHNQWIRSKTLPNKTGKKYKVLIPKNR